MSVARCSSLPQLPARVRLLAPPQRRLLVLAALCLLPVLAGSLPGPLTGTGACLAEDDDRLQHRVESLFQADVRIRGDEIEVEVSNGRVMLRGEVDEPLDRLVAEHLAKRVSGVSAVTNFLKVAPASRRDSEIQEDVERILRPFLGSTATRSDPPGASQSVVVRASPAADSFRFSVCQGVVTLEGSVDTLSQEQRAVRRAEAVRGVRLVRNLLQIRDKPERGDEDLRHEAQTALDRHAAFEGLRVEVACTNGIAGLTGTVHHLYQLELASRLVEDVEGVKAVKNELRLNPDEPLAEASGPPRDVDLEAFVFRALDQDPRLSLDQLGISANEGQITLRGRAPNLEQSWMAERVTRAVAGVRDVTNQLEIPREAADRTILEAVETALRQDSSIPDDAVRVEIKMGTAILSGDVPSWRARFTAARIAAQTPGVVALENELQVVASGSVNDAEIVDHLRRRLHANSILKPVADKISVRVESGRVTLTGTVPGWLQKRELERAALFTHGVRSVDNQVTVTPPTRPAKDQP